MMRRLFAWSLRAAVLTYSSVLSLLPAPATAQQVAQAPAKSMQADAPSAQTDRAAAKSTAKYSPQQQQQLDRANDLLLQASKFNDQSKHTEAASSAAKALSIRESILPANDIEIANACTWLALLQKDAGKLAEALPASQRALKIYETALGPDHLTVATACNNLASIYQDLDRLAEALPLYERALKIREKALGPNHPDVAQVLNNLAELHRAQGNYALALPLLQRTLEIDEKALGPNDPEVATDLNNLALLYEDQGNYPEALPLFQRAIKIDEKALGADDPGVATDLNNLAELYRAQANYAAALPLHERALSIRERTLGPVHPEVAESLNNLASLDKDQGNYAAALPLYQRALKIREQVFGPVHSAVAQSLNNLALLYHSQGNYAEALPLYQRAVKIDEQVLGPDHPNLATWLNNLALLYQEQGKLAEALPLYERCLQIKEKSLGPNHPGVATALNNLALLYQAQSRFADALPLYQRAIRIDEKALGPNHPDLASWLNNLASLYVVQGNYAEALPLYQRSLKIGEQAQGVDHPELAATLDNLALLQHTLGNFAQAEALSHRALAILRTQLERTAVIQSERQQLSMAEMVRDALDNYLTVSRNARTPPEDVYAEVLAWKGSVSARQQAMRQLRAISKDPEVAAIYKQLADAAQQLDSLSRATPTPEQTEQYRQKLSALNQDYETLQQRLAASSVEYRQQLAQQKLTPAKLQRALPADAVLVDFLEYWHYQPPQEKGEKPIVEQRLAVFVVCRDRPVQWVELGSSKPIADLVDHWRQSYSPADGAELRRLVWRPLEENLAGAATILVSPDGALDRFPLAALPGKKSGTYLIEDVAIATVPVPRLLPEILTPVSSASSSANHDEKNARPSLLTVGEVDFQAALSPSAPAEELALRAPLAKDGVGWQFGPLEGTRAEIVAINDSFQQRFPDAKLKSLRKAQATRQAVFDSLPRYRYVHLATHGFFAPPQLKSALNKNQTDGVVESHSNAQTGALDMTGYHPDLLCGLALAGANQPAKPGEDDGILTALAVEELDLSNLQLATLSACETGLGQAAGGEGVLGLQRAFQLAGAKSTMATLWKIPDKASQLLMTDFYDNLWNASKPMSKLEALRQAQLKMLREGGNRGLELPDDQASAKNADHASRMPPFFWAAYELSGDWR